MKRIFIITSSLLLVSLGAVLLPKSRFEAVGFYNLDKFFDTIDNKRTADDAYLPYGIKRWTSTKYRQKLERMAFAISQIAIKEAPQGLAVLGVCEVENRNVLENLISTPPLSEQQWGIVHYDSPDRQGLDVALLYQKNRFEVIRTQRIPLYIPNKPTFRSRDQLLVTGRLGNEIVHFIVVHYPARGDCEKCTRIQRLMAAKLTLKIVKHIQSKDINAKIIIMGDFNDNPASHSISMILGAKQTIGETRKGDLFNTSYALYNDGARSTVYRSGWYLFDQQIVSHSLLQGNSKGFNLYQSTVFSTPFLADKYTKGRPSNTLARGFSAHFPTYLVLINESVKTTKLYSSPKTNTTITTVTKKWTTDTMRTEYLLGQANEVDWEK